MAEIHYFRCASPRQRRFLSNGSAVKFTAVTHETGIFATDNEFVARELDTMQAYHTAGVFRIEQKEYDKLKKNPISARPWREELGRRGVEFNHAPASSSAETTRGPALSGEPEAVAVAPDAARAVGALPVGAAERIEQQAQQAMPEAFRPKASPRKK